jgi:uncharacterized protein YbaR (Trm112 family)
MPSDSERIAQFDSSSLELLACPACLGRLSVLEPHLICANCGRAYPLVDGIPVLIADRAEPGHQREKI